jgi:DedD protein
MASEDTEITLGVGRLLGLFLLLALICGVFFSIGYSLGKNSAREQALNDQPGQVLAAAPLRTSAAGAAGDRAPASTEGKVDSKAATGQRAQEHAEASDSNTNLTFFNSVKESGSGGESQSPATTSADSERPAVEAAAKPKSDAEGPRVIDSAGQPASASHAAPEASRSALVTGPGTIVVQIAAVSREDDAVALAGALRKKNYNVFVVNNPITHDKLYHVQIGPFATMPEAEATKAKLVAEGYNPIVKR